MKNPFLRILTNKYLVTMVVFGVWMIFFDENNLRKEAELRKEMAELYQMRSYYKEEIAKNREAIEELTTNKETLEKFAREKYLMRRDSEDVFLVWQE